MVKLIVVARHDSFIDYCRAFDLNPRDYKSVKKVDQHSDSWRGYDHSTATVVFGDVFSRIEDAWGTSKFLDVTGELMSTYPFHSQETLENLKAYRQARIEELKRADSEEEKQKRKYYRKRDEE